MKVRTYMQKREDEWLEIVECPWCGRFESHFAVIENPPDLATVLCQWCVKQIAECILEAVEKADSQAGH